MGAEAVANVDAAAVGTHAQAGRAKLEEHDPGDRDGNDRPEASECERQCDEDPAEEQAADEAVVEGRDQAQPPP